MPMDGNVIRSIDRSRLIFRFRCNCEDLVRILTNKQRWRIVQEIKRKTEPNFLCVLCSCNNLFYSINIPFFFVLLLSFTQFEWSIDMLLSLIYRSFVQWEKEMLSKNVIRWVKLFFIWPMICLWWSFLHRWTCLQKSILYSTSRVGEKDCHLSMELLHLVFLLDSNKWWKSRCQWKNRSEWWTFLVHCEMYVESWNTTITCGSVGGEFDHGRLSG